MSTFRDLGRADHLVAMYHHPRRLTSVGILFRLRTRRRASDDELDRAVLGWQKPGSSIGAGLLLVTAAVIMRRSTCR
jgi:hypothetical protein